MAPSKRTSPNIVDSSAWLEYFGNGSAEQFASAIETVGRLVVPAVCLLDVFKIVLRQQGERDALQAVALMQQGTVVDLDASLVLAAATVGIAHKLP